jgi:hypothetical protein
MKRLTSTIHPDQPVLVGDTSEILFVDTTGVNAVIVFRNGSRLAVLESVDEVSLLLELEAE